MTRGGIVGETEGRVGAWMGWKGGQQVGQNIARIVAAICAAARASQPSPSCTYRARSPAPPAPRARSKPKTRLFAPQDLGLLEAPDRDQWQKPDQIMDALASPTARSSPTSAPAAAGSRFGSRAASDRTALVYAEDIQPPMIEAIGRRVQRENLQNVRDGARHGERSAPAAAASTRCSSSTRITRCRRIR